jgi:hypothetical protein
VEKQLAPVTRTRKITMQVKYFKVKHKVLKNSLHGQLWSGFDFFFLKCQKKLEFFLKHCISSHSIILELFKTKLLILSVYTFPPILQKNKS